MEFFYQICKFQMVFTPQLTSENQTIILILKFLLNVHKKSDLKRNAKAGSLHAESKNYF